MSGFASLRRAALHEIKTLRGAIYRRLSQSREQEQDLVTAFHRLYFDARAFNMTWRNTYWMGTAILKCPLDLWLYQEMLHTVRPAVVIETGTAFGGSAHFLGSMLDIVGHGRVVTIDIDERPGRPAHPRVTYVTGSSTDPAIVSQVADLVAGASPVLVLLDSDHAKDHVLRELQCYAPMVSRGSYLIVEDTNLNGHPVDPEFGPGPMEAIEAFLPSHPEFEHDPAMDKFFLTFNPKGYLKRR
ncbi:MAG: CmcI family methyltransferase [Vicinamibacterales bacterium]|nr:CmcI family methyltransferase [Vicinamibacterales bacterium]